MSDEARMVRRQANVTNLSVADLLDWCAQHDLSPEQVEVTGTHLKWATPETDEERDRREQHQRAAEERTEKWEREALVRLTEKYGSPS